MKQYVFILLALISATTCLSQETYQRPSMTPSTNPSYGETITPKGFSNFQSSRQKKIFVISNIPYTTYNLVVSPLETEIIELEAKECEALKKKDTIALRRLWVRDFTLDQDQNTVVEGESAIPNYMSIGRTVDVLTIMDANTVSTSGNEGYQQIRLGKMESGTRPYFHTWMRKNGIWKLVTKG